MAVTIQCAACQRRIAVPDNLDRTRQYRCPGCGGPLVIPGAAPDPPVDLGAANLAATAAPNYPPPPPAPAFDIGDRDQERDREPDRGSGRDAPSGSEPEVMDADTRQTLRTGTLLHMIAHGTYLLGLLLTIILFLVAASDDSSTSSRGRTTPDEGKFMIFMLLLYIIAMMGQFVLALVAEGFWLSAPWKYGARGMACALTAVSLVILIRQSAFAHLFESIGSAGRGRGSSGPRMEEEFGMFGPLLLIILEAARLSLIAATTNAIGRNIRRSNPPTAGAGLLAMLAPVAILGAFLLTILVMLVSDDKSLDSAKTKMILLMLLNLLTLAGMVLWGVLCMLTLHSSLGRRPSRSY